MKAKIYQSLSQNEELLAKAIVDASYHVHKVLGPGLLESVYEMCFCYELEKRGIKYKRQVPVPTVCDGKIFGAAFKLDILVDDQIICELKAVENILPLFEAQILTYLRLTHKRLGSLINFNVVMIKNGVKRIIL
jgi:GxxExxY protein